jgi:hypothetical protein
MSMLTPSYPTDKINEINFEQPNAGLKHYQVVLHINKPKILNWDYKIYYFGNHQSDRKKVKLV